MLVTGVQAVGSKGLTAVQGTVVDPKDATRLGRDGDSNSEHSAAVGAKRRGEPQPVVFPRKGVPVDQRPVAMRHEQAAARYRADGGDHHDDAA
jgi:hypothetical protein